MKKYILTQINWTNLIYSELINSIFLRHPLEKINKMEYNN